MRYANLQFSGRETHNLGDNIQIMAIDRLYEKMGIKADTITRIPVSDLSSYRSPDGQKLLLPISFPFLDYVEDGLAGRFSDDIKPIFLGLTHMNKRYSEKEISFLKKHEPIGCREEYTYNNLKRYGIDCWLNGCMTLTIDSKEDRRTGNHQDVFIVDICDELRRYIPPELMKDAVELSQIVKLSPGESIENYVSNRYQQYFRNAKLVITSKLHCVVPCFAMGIPVILAVKQLSYRFAWVEKILNVYTEQEFGEIDWTPAQTDITSIQNAMLENASSLLLDGCATRKEEINRYYLNRQKKSYVIEGYDDAVQYCKSHPIGQYAFWGLTTLSEMIDDYLKENVPGSRCVYTFDKYRTVHFRNLLSQPIGSVPTEQLRDVTVFVTASAATKEAAAFFQANLTDNYFLCYDHFIRSGGNAFFPERKERGGIKLSDYVYDFLKKKGVRHVFMLPGGGAMHLVDSLGRSGIRYLCCQHEQAVACAAMGYAECAGVPGVITVTSGPGATNAITGVVAAWIDSIPMIVISGQAKRADLVGDKKVRQIGSQEVQIVEMVKPITKYAVQIMEPTEIRYHLERAFREATSGRPGPVWLSIPLDVQGSIIKEEALAGDAAEEQPEPDISSDIRRIIELFKQARKPVILAGNGIHLSGAAPEFLTLSRILSAPVQTTWKSLDLMAEDDPLYAGHPGSMGDRGANFIVQQADFYFVIGSRLDTSITAFNEPNFAKNAKKAIIDIDQHEIDRIQMTFDSAVCCDAGYAIRMLTEAARDAHLPDYSEWLRECKACRANFPLVTEAHREKKTPISIYYLTELLSTRTDGTDIIVPESSSNAAEITLQAWRVKAGQKIKHAGGLGSMGFGLPYAIGCCIAGGRRRTILVNGDGAFQLNIQELETLRRLWLPIKIFILSNGGYASIRNMQLNNFHTLVASMPESGFTVPSSAKVAQAFGIPASTTSSADELLAIMDHMINSDGPYLCEVAVSPEEGVSPRVKSVRLADGSMVSGALDAMWPFLNESVDGICGKRRQS